MRTFLRATPESTDLVPAKALDPLVVAAYQCVYGKRAAAKLGVAPDAMAQTVGVAEALLALETAIRKRVIESGDADAMLLAKTEAPEAMRRIIGLASSAPDARTKLAANDKILALAGVVAPKAPEGRTANDLMDEMTVPELHAFVEHGIWPARFGDHMKRLALQRELKQRGAITVEARVVAEEDEDAA